MDEFERTSEESEPLTVKAGPQDEIVVRAARFLREARPKLHRLIVFARPRAQAAGQEALRYVREHEDEIKQAAVKLARYRLRGPLRLVINALTPDSSPGEPDRGTGCPQCGMMNLLVAKFCTECGVRLASESPGSE